MKAGQKLLRWKAVSLRSKTKSKQKERRIKMEENALSAVIRERAMKETVL